MILSGFDLVAGIKRGDDVSESGTLGGPTPYSSRAREIERNMWVARTESLGSSFDISGIHAISPTGTSYYNAKKQSKNTYTC